MPSVQPFPNSVAAIKRFEANGRANAGLLWQIGDAILAECGAPSRNGVNNGSHRKLTKLAAVLAKSSMRRSVVWLRKLRDTAHAIPADRRLSGVDFWVHEAAGNADTLGAAEKQAKKRGVELTIRFVREFKARRRREQQQQQRTRHPKLKNQPTPDHAAEKSTEEVLGQLADIGEIIDAVQREIATYRDRYSDDARHRIQAGWIQLEKRFRSSNPQLGGELREAAE